VDDVEKYLAAFALLAGAFKAITSGLKDLNDISKERKEKATLSGQEETSQVGIEGG